MILSVGVLVHGSGVLHDDGIIGPAPIVTAASSQYFQRTFNRLVAAPPVVEAPIVTVTPVTPQVIAAQPVVINTPVTEIRPEISPESNLAIAIATAHAAPVSTILLPPFPFAPHTLPLLPEFTPINVSSKEETTEKTGNKNTKEPVTSRPRTPEFIEPASNNNDLSQLPLETNTKIFDSYGMVPPKPQKLKTEVEIVPVPLTYIMPPPIKQQPIKYVHKFVPSKIIIRPVKYISAPLRIRYIVPKKLSSYRVPSQQRSFNPSSPQIFPGRPTNSIRDTEPTTFRPFLRPNTKPPRL